jgi:acyl-CoA thioesterase
VSLGADTALERVGDGRWRGEIFERWWVARGPFGGFVSTLITRAVMATVDDPGRPPRSLTVHFIEAPVAGPIDLAVAVEREGRSTTALSVRLEQEGRTVGLALAGCAAWRDGEPEWAAAAPSAPPPEHCPRLPSSDGAPRFFDQLDVRWVSGGHPGRAADDGRNLAWLRLDPPQPFDHLALTALSDGWMPAAFSRLGRFAVVPTLDLTIHFRARLPVEADWVLAEYRSRFSAGGAWEEDGELWAPDGTLLTQSRQLAMIRDPR